MGMSIVQNTEKNQLKRMACEFNYTVCSLNPLRRFDLQQMRLNGLFIFMHSLNYLRMVSSV
jgi:hypothetical protein